ncbi:hypothetical protein N7462_001412 [Penicillium macrosclerotiorum]|uniref:uncharacterized protein n=1 Tax=Penicillium macrosclerotiorum TaxID=303699 RepID=UPI00254890DE|nr:uncharacterized protein N7462_001412 [Penicillium macrosclerotiorum]KAJ5691989.1 hypothetical protein N7462_001412 [Penicillium macrosclerotiorum]
MFYRFECFSSKSLLSLWDKVEYMKPHIDAYQIVLQYRQCSPRVILHIQWNVASNIMLEGQTRAKQCRNNPESLLLLIEGIKTDCMEQIKVSKGLLDDIAGEGRQEDHTAARSLLELKLHLVFARLCGLGLLYASVLRSRLLEGENNGDPNIHSKESLRIVDQVAGSMNSPPDAPGQHLFTFLSRFGGIYPDQLVRVLEVFVECAELKMGGIIFKSPLQRVIYNVVNVCKKHFREQSCSNKSFRTPRQRF